jgi:hypothetical protein
MTPERPAGTVDWPSPPPQATTEPDGVVAATGIAAGPAQTAKSPESKSAAGTMPRRWTDGRREAGEPP